MKNKKFLIVAGILGITLAVTGCGKNNNTVDNNTSSETSSETSNDASTVEESSSFDTTAVLKHYNDYTLTSYPNSTNGKINAEKTINLKFDDKECLAMDIDNNGPFLTTYNPTLNTNASVISVVFQSGKLDKTIEIEGNAPTLTFDYNGKAVYAFNCNGKYIEFYYLYDSLTFDNGAKEFFLHVTAELNNETYNFATEEGIKKYLDWFYSCIQN